MPLAIIATDERLLISSKKPFVILAGEKPVGRQRIRTGNRGETSLYSRDVSPIAPPRILKVMERTPVHKENRLAKREEFQKVYRHGKSSANHQFVVYRLHRPAPAPLRLGVSVSKKVGNAVVRNRIRRTVKEIVRLHLDKLETNVDIIVIARKPVAEMEHAGMQSSLLHVFKRASLLKKTR